MPGFWARIGDAFGSFAPAQTVLPDPYESWVSTAGIPVADPGTPLELLNRKTYVAEVWRTQPNIRKVVDFIASNIATIPLQVFDRVDDNNRQRITDDETGLAAVLKEPAEGQVGAFRFWHGVVSDWMLYDFWVVLPVWGDTGLVGLQHVPSWRVSHTVDAFNIVTGLRFWDGAEYRDLNPAEVVFDHGYAPHGAGCTPMEALREMLAEQREALDFRKRSFRNGLRGGGYISRPVDAPKWTDTARARFENAMRKYRTDGKESGGLPLLDDGMKIESNPIGSLRDAQDLAARELSAVGVDNLFHIPPELLGDRRGNYSNVDAYRQALYRDHLGPYITAWEQAVGVQLLHLVENFTGQEYPDRYVEANLDTKLRGSFEQRAQQMQLASGGPWRTLNEVRALDNLPPVANGDEVLRPLNMGQATQGAVDSGPVADVAPVDAPVDPAPKAETPLQRALRKAAAAHLKADAPTDEGDVRPEDEETAKALVEFFARQRGVVLSKMGAEWWDEERWNEELKNVLYPLAIAASAGAAREALALAEMDPETYDVQRTMAFLEAATELNAASLNDFTRQSIEDELEAEDENGNKPAPKEAAAKVFDVAEGSRAVQAAIGLVSFAANFGAVESARQSGGDAPTKTWRTTSSHPRPSHRKMDGETVGIDEDFSNGLPWPGHGSDADEVAGCRCSVTINY